MRRVSRSDRVLVVSQVPPPLHGSTLVTRLFLDLLDDHGFEVTLVDRRFSTSVREVGRFSSRKVLSALLLVARLVRSVVRNRPAVCVFFITNRKFSALVDWMLIELLRLFKVPVVHYVHTSGYRALAGSRAWRFVVARMLGGASRVVILGDRLSDDVAPWVAEGDVRVIPNATDPRDPEGSAAVSRWGTEGPVPRVLFFSNLMREKGAVEFARLSEALLRLGVEAQFLMLGASSDPETRSEIDVIVGSHDSISYGGVVEGDEKWATLSDADVMVFPSTYQYEAQPLSIIEAFAMSCPVVAYDIGGIADLVIDGVNGRLINAGDGAALEREVRSLIENADLRASLSAGARQSFVERHSIRAYLGSWTDVLSEVGCRSLTERAGRYGA